VRLRLAALALIPVYAGVCAAQPAPAIFEFHSGFWINLHQFLMHQAAAPEAAPSDPPEWRDAVSYYRRVMAQQDRMGRARLPLPLVAGAQSVESGLDRCGPSAACQIWRLDVQRDRRRVSDSLAGHPDSR